MLRLEDFAPTRHESEMVAQYPEQVAIGYLRAARKANKDKRIGDGDTGLGNLFGGLFK